MIDDYDESSGWMFLLVPAHPGFPGQIPQSRKTVVCCVCVSRIDYFSILQLTGYCTFWINVHLQSLTTDCILNCALLAVLTMLIKNKDKVWTFIWNPQ